MGLSLPERSIRIHAHTKMVRFLILTLKEQGQSLKQFCFKTQQIQLLKLRSVPGMNQITGCVACSWFHIYLPFWQYFDIPLELEWLFYCFPSLDIVTKQVREHFPCVRFCLRLRYTDDQTGKGFAPREPGYLSRSWEWRWNMEPMSTQQRHLSSCTWAFHDASRVF